MIITLSIGMIEKNLNLLYMSTEAEINDGRNGGRDKEKRNKMFSKPPNKLRTKKTKISRNRSRSISPPNKLNKKRPSRTKSRTNSKSKSRTNSKSRSVSRSRSRSMRVSRTQSRSREKSIRNESNLEEKDEEYDEKMRRKGEWNPITFKKYSDNYYKIQESVKKLPASNAKVKQDIFNILNDTNIMLITADTGAGKTTQVPKIIWEYMNYNDTIICTQPRTLTAASVAKRVAEEMDLELGRHVGFRFKGSEKDKGGAIAGMNILVYMENKTFLHNTLKNLSSLSDYGAIILDEAHDRAIATDVLMFYIRETLMRPGVHTKFIIMSATLDKEVFLDYFKDQDIREYHITGRTYPVKSVSLMKSIYENTVSDDYVIFKAVDRMTKLIVRDIFKKRDEGKEVKGNEHNDILIFLPSKKQIFALKESLTEMLEENQYKNYLIMDLSADVPIGPERELRLHPKPGYTKIIISTNIAETGVTVEGITYVIDSGLAFNVEFDSETRENVMDLGFISQAEAKQREGRAGRMQPGYCYRLYTNEEYNKFIEHKKPEIYRERIDDILLEFFFQYRGLENNYKFVMDEILGRMITPPTKKGLERTLTYFRELGLLQGEGDDTRMKFGARISKMGECYRGMQLKFENINMLYTAINYDVEPEIIADIVAILDIKSDIGGWIGDRRKGGLPKKYWEQYVNKYGDIMGLYHIYLDYKDEKLPKEFVEEYMNVNNFKLVEDKSAMIIQDIRRLYVCSGKIETKYKMHGDMYMNLVSAINQVYGKSNIIKTKELNMKKYENNFLEEMNKLEEMMYLSKITKKIFGGNAKQLYDNFVSVIN